MEERIIVENITKRYGGNTVVDNISFRVKKGEVFGLLGHNGAGKSTTIDCMLGLCTPDEGHVVLLNQNRMKQRRKIFEKIGVQLQHSNYQSNIRVNELCAEMSCLYQHPADYMSLLKRFQMDPFLNHKVNDLSGGEKQKLSVVLALLPDPKIIFLDELTTGLDVAARRDVWKILNELKAQGMTIFLTTHYMEEAENLCDRIMIIKSGQMIVTGRVEEVIHQSPYQSLEEAYLWFVEREEDIR